MYTLLSLALTALPRLLAVYPAMGLHEDLEPAKSSTGGIEASQTKRLIN